MSALAGAALFVGELILIAGTCLAFHERGYKRGRDEGYKLGRIEADNWWLNAERQVDQARQTIWKEHL